MPSDAKKRRDAKKKEAAKARTQKKPQKSDESTNETNGSNTPVESEPITNGDSQLSAGMY